MKQANREVGRLGERLAADYLLSQGYIILERNFSTRFGEIDLICSHNNVVVFIEVKTKKGLAFGSPEEMVGKNKLWRVKNMGQVYLRGREVPCRIDIVAVELDGQNLPQSVRHYENVILD